MDENEALVLGCPRSSHWNELRALPLGQSLNTRGHPGIDSFNLFRAKESTLKQRVIMKAKRRGVTSSDSASKGIGSAFGGFGAKMATTKPSTGFSFEAKTGSLPPNSNDSLLESHYVIVT